jgi:hypothetical protein
LPFCAILAHWQDLSFFAGAFFTASVLGAALPGAGFTVPAFCADTANASTKLINKRNFFILLLFDLVVCFYIMFKKDLLVDSLVRLLQRRPYLCISFAKIEDWKMHE